MATPIELMVTVKAYPNLSELGEGVCVAGIRTDLARPEWVRLFPIPFRDLPFSQRFKKYQVIRVQASPARGDRRPESMTPVIDTLEVGEWFSTASSWRKRMLYIEPLMRESMCEIQRRQTRDKSSLGVFRPADVSKLEIKAIDESWKPSKQALANQPTLFTPTKSGLKKIPYRFKYVYRCSDSACNGHEQSLVDWEIGASFFNWRRQYGEAGLLDRIRARWLDEICGADRDTIFYVGNQKLHPTAFLVLGTAYPKLRRPKGERR